jgi:hypothetical protein
MVRALAGHMNWETRCTMPGWDTLAERGGRPGRALHKSTVARFLVWLQGRGYLGVVLPGWTPALRAASLTDPDDENQRAVYVLTSPGRHSQKRAIRPAEGHGTVTNATLTREALLPYSPSRACAREEEEDEQVKNQIKGEEERAARALSVLPRGRGPAAGAGRKSQDRAEGLEWARSVRGLVPVLAPLSGAHVRHLGRRQRLAGWSPRDFVHALQRPRHGRPYGFTAEVRHPAAWVRARLAAWTLPGGELAPSPSAARAAARAAEQAERAAYEAERVAVAARAAAATSVAHHGLLARAGLAGTAAAAAIVQATADARAARRRQAASPDGAGARKATAPTGTAAGNRPRSTPRSPLPPRHAPAPPMTPAPAPPPRVPELPAWWADAAAAAARAVAEQEAAEQAGRAGCPP